MAINVNTVYRTVLLILNKEQRGYMTPDEFNKIGTQVQREIFERYFEDLNQQSRLSKNDVDYANRLELTEEKLQEFKTYSSPAYAASTDDFPVPTDLYKLGNIAFRKVNYDATNLVSTYSQNYKELQRVNRHDFNLIRRSKLVEPSKNYGVFLYEGDRIKVHPKIAQVNGQTPIELDYLKKPDDVRWGYTIGSLGQFLYDSTAFSTSTLASGSTLTVDNFNSATATAGTYTITQGTDLTVSPAGGTGATIIVTITGSGTVTLDSTNTTIEIASSSGTGYSIGDVFTISGGITGLSANLVLNGLANSNLMSGSTQGSTNFLLHNSEQAEVVLNILLYAGVIIRDPQAVQTAMAQVQKDEVNEKQ